MKLSQPYWTPLKVTIDYFVACLNTYPKIQKNHRLKYALLNQLVNIPYFEYHSIADMLELFGACKYQTHRKGQIIKYSFDKIIIMLRGKIIFNYQPGDQSDLEDEILPEAIRNFRKKLETNTKVENFEDLKRQEMNGGCKKDENSEPENFNDYRMELLDDGYITPESKQLYKNGNREVSILVTEHTDLFVIDDPRMVFEIEPVYFRSNFYTKLNFF
jgi:hypothetical protein